MRARPILPTNVGTAPRSLPAAFGRLVSLAGVRLLEVGCGRGDVLAVAAGAGAEVWGVDEVAADLTVAATRVPGADLRLASAADLPFDTGMFDVVCSFGALGGAALRAAITEMTRVCRAGGTIVLQPVAQSGRPDPADPTY